MDIRSDRQKGLSSTELEKITHESADGEAVRGTAAEAGVHAMNKLCHRFQKKYILLYETL